MGEGAAAAGMSQSVASRRVAALEERFGERLFERTSRRAVLTPFGRDMLPAARQLVQAAGVLLDEAEAVKHKPGPARRVWIQPEDDVPHIRDPLTRLRDAVGLRPAQVLAAPDLTAAAAEVLCSGDLLLCSRAQAAELALAWHPIGELTLRRGYALTVVADGNPLPMEVRLGEAIARCLGVDDPAATGGGKPA
ncbi:LysR family transcriptional regulator [Streptomyces sp. NPDC091287]|uniref:LysR family transcriptional regulator n=1 Tax=Streptomyces sp. NPDC091287 TaxID=3365988 RepID=UPI0038208819